MVHRCSAMSVTAIYGTNTKPIARFFAAGASHILELLLPFAHIPGLTLPENVNEPVRLTVGQDYVTAVCNSTHMI